MGNLAEVMVKVGADISDFTKDFQTVNKTLTGTADKASDTMNRTEKSVSGSTNSMMSGFVGLAGTIASAFSFNASANFMKDIFQTTADLQAVDAQFSQIFGNMSDTAQKKLDELGNAYGIFPERLKPMFTQMTSKFKGLGYTTEEAMAMAENGLNLASDAAAFYDKSLEDVQGNLNSFINGNYEAGDAIGLNTNATNIADWVNQQYGLSFDKMTEAQKQNMRLEYAKSVYDQAEVTGQASREADNYSNKVGNLTAVWDNLKATLGTPIIGYVIEGMKTLTGIIQQVAEKFQALSPQTQALISGLGAVLVIGLPLVSMFGFMIMGLGALATPIVGVVAGLALFGGAMVALWKTSDTFRNTITTVFEAVKQKVSTAMGAVTGFIKDKWSQIKKFWDENGKTIQKATENVFNFIKKIVEVTMPVIEAIIRYVWNAIKGVIDGALKVIMGLVKTFASLLTGDFKGMWEGIKQLFSGAIQLVWNLMSLSFVGAIRKLLVSFAKGGIQILKGFADDMYLKFLYGKDKVVSLITNMKSTITNLFNGIKSTATNIFNAVKSAITKPIETAKNTVLGIITAIKNAFSAMKITIPKPKIPKISVSMGSKSIAGVSIPFPQFDVSWNAKGAIFNGASVLGGGQGVGEKGAEAVIPIQHKRYMRPFAKAVAEHLGTGRSHDVIEPITVNLTYNGTSSEREVQKMMDVISRELYSRQKRKERGRL